MSISSGYQRTILYSAAAFFALAILILVYVLGSARALAFAIPAAALVLGMAFYVISGPAYIEYICWVWFLAPFLRRLVDYAQGYYTPTSVIILSPVLVSLICSVTLFRSLIRGRLPVASPFILVLTAIFVAFTIGMVRNGITAAIYDALTWSAPLFVGYYVASNFHLYPTFKRTVQRAFMLGGFVLGIYGILQFVNPAPWDRLWMDGAEMASIGHPEPFMVRVFGPLNAPGPYAMALMVTLTLAMAGRGFLAIGPATAGLLLSLVRSAWGGLAVGMLWYAKQTRGQERVRLLMLVGLAALLALPFLQYGPIQERVEGRTDSLTQLHEDNSMRARLALYKTYGPRSLARDPLGRGMGALGTAAKLTQGGTVSFDSGVFAVPLILGIPGALLYLYGFGLLLSRFILKRQPDRFTQAASAVVVSILTLLIFANQLNGFSGMLLWLCVGLVVSGHLYYGKIEN